MPAPVVASPRALNALEDRGDPEAAGAADRDRGVALAAPDQLVDGVQQQDRAGGAVRVAERDRAAVRVEPVVADARA